MLKCSETDQKFPAAREAYQTEGWMQGIRIVSRIKAAILEIRFKLEPCISKVILFFPFTEAASADGARDRGALHLEAAHRKGN